MAPAEPSLVTGVKPVQKTPPRVQQHCPCCSFVTRGSTACMAPNTAQHQRHMPLNQTPARAPEQHPPPPHPSKTRTSSLPRPQTPQGIPPVCCCQTTGPGQSRGTTGAAPLGLHISAGLVPLAAQAQARAALQQEKRCQRESSHTADKAWGENGIRDSKKFQKLLQILH